MFVSVCLLFSSAQGSTGYTATGAPCVALTFDDGPSVETPRLLDLLDAGHIPATFYVIGKNAKRFPDTIRREATLGEEIGNHSWDHRVREKTSFEVIVAEYAQTDAAIETILGTKISPATLRAPYGIRNRAIENDFAPRRFVFWTIDTLDWKYRDAERTTKIVLDEAHAGSIVLLHDTHSTSVDAVPAIIDGLEARGFIFARVSEMKTICAHKAPSTPDPLK